MRNTIIITVILFVAVIGSSIYYFSSLNAEKDESTKPLTYLPAETFLIARFHNDATTDNIFKDFDIFEAMVGKSTMKDWQDIKTNLLRSSAMQRITAEGDMYISLHPSKDAIESLFTIPVTEAIDQSSLGGFISSLSEGYRLSQADTLETTVYSLAKDSSAAPLYAIYHKQVFFASHSKNLVLRVADKSKDKIKEEHIDFFAETNNRNSPLSVYFANDQVAALSKHLMRQKAGSFIGLFDELGGQSAWNLNFKNDALILSGESETNGNKENYVELFSTQSKVTQTLYNVFPEHTASYLSFAISDRKKFQSNLYKLFDRRSEEKTRQQLFETLKKDKSLNFDKELSPAFGDEFAIVEQSNGAMLAFITINDSTKFDGLVAQIGTAVRDSIYRFDNSHVLYTLYGDPMKTFTRPYFMRIENTLIVANSQSSLLAYQKDWERSNLLKNSIGFKNSERIQGNEANITFFSLTRTSSGLIANLLKSNFRNAYRDKENFGYQDFYSWSAQISGSNGNFLSNIYGIYKSKYALGASPDWTYQLDHRAITEPWVFEHSDTSQFILIQEQDHTMHGIHPSGKKMWSSVFHGRTVGQAQQLADRSIIVVTDKNRLYRFDSSGNPLSGFSIGMPHEPTYSPTVAKLNNEELIFVPAGENLMVYTMDGKVADSWRNISVEGKILFDVKVANDRVFVGTESGSFYQFDAQGQLLRKETQQGSRFKNPIAVRVNENKNFALTAIDTAGYLYALDFNSKASKRKLADWGAGAYIHMASAPNYAPARITALDNKNLYIHNPGDSTAMVAYTFTKDIDDSPQYFGNGAAGYSIGIASRANYHIYLFDDNGALLEGFPIEGFPSFYAGKIDYNSGNYLLVVRRDKKLYAFKN